MSEPLGKRYDRKAGPGKLRTLHSAGKDGIYYFITILFSSLSSVSIHLNAQKYSSMRIPILSLSFEMNFSFTVRDQIYFLYSKGRHSTNDLTLTRRMTHMFLEIENLNSTFRWCPPAAF